MEVVVSSSPAMLQGPASAAARGGAATLTLTLVLAGCAQDEDACHRIEAARLWSGPPSGRLCIVDDLLVSGRGPDEIAALERVEEIDGALILGDSPALPRSPEFHELTRIGGALAISGNKTLTSVAGFPNLVAVEGRIYIAENPRLRTIELGPRLTSAGAIFIALNPSLEHIYGLQALEQVETDLRLERNGSLMALEFPALTEVGEDFVVADLPGLRTLETPELRVVTGLWSLVDNASLESLANSLAALERVGDVRIEGNDALTEIAWETEFEVRRSLYVVDNISVERISGTDAVRLSPGALVNFSRHPNLLEIEGFAGVETLNNLVIEANPALRVISGLRSLRTLSGRLEVIDNDALGGPAEWFPALSRASTVWIFGNTSLPTTSVDDLLAHVTTMDDPRIGDNGGEDTMLDPCPWPGDGVCDALGAPDRPGTGLCALDPEDCGQ